MFNYKTVPLACQSDIMLWTPLGGGGLEHISRPEIKRIHTTLTPLSTQSQKHTYVHIYDAPTYNILMNTVAAQLYGKYVIYTVSLDL